MRCKTVGEIHRSKRCTVKAEVAQLTAMPLVGLRMVAVDVSEPLFMSKSFKNGASPHQTVEAC